MDLLNRSLWSFLFGALVLATLPAAGEEWSRFRGPEGSGIAEGKGLPLKWNDDEGVVWKTQLPGPGSSSPIVASGHVFVTCYSGYGVSRGSPGNIEDLRLHVVCVDGKSGEIQWDRSIEAQSGEAAFRGIGIPQHGYASSTPTSDGERVYAFFGKSGVVAYDLKGKELWRAAVAPEPRTHMFGSGSSPVLYENLLIVPVSVECEAIVAFDKLTGKEAWRARAEGYGGWWGTPIIVEADDRKQLLISVPGEIWSLSPKTGKLIWFAETFEARGMCTSVVAADGVVYTVGGRDGGGAAVKIGGRGDTTQANVLWTGTSGPYVPSPVIVDGRLLWVSGRGIVNCLNGKTGERVSQQRLEGAGDVYASLFAADGKLYVVTRRNGTFVLAAGQELKQLAHNVFASDETDFNGSPAVMDGKSPKLLLRSYKALYCAGKPGE